MSLRPTPWISGPLPFSKNGSRQTVLRKMKLMSEAQKDAPLRGDVMDVEGVAEYLGLAPSTIYDKVRDQDIPHTRLGNLIRFRKTDIDRWLGENTVYPQPNLQRALARA
ncbi:MAG TPA: DNA-binding protein, partial [Phycisphaerales bacterium]|nr:DNA-binding protein [Phycisphaerales bacterium]